MQETGYVFKTSLKPLLHVPQFCLNPVILLELQIKKKKYLEVQPKLTGKNLLENQ